MLGALYPAADWNAMRHEWPNSAHSVFVRCGEMRWHVQRMGQGPVCLLLHGTGASTHTWRDLMPLLARHHTVYAVDLPGHAFSHTLPHVAPSLPNVAQALMALLNQLKVRPALWVGHSAGAAIAAQCLMDAAWRSRSVGGPEPGLAAHARQRALVLPIGGLGGGAQPAVGLDRGQAGATHADGRQTAGADRLKH